MAEPSYETGVATPDERRRALELALTPLAPSARGPLLDAVGAAGDHPLGALSALVVARRTGRVEAAAWVQPCPGRSASYWPPEWAKKRPRSAAGVESRLTALATQVADAARVELTQTLFESPEDPRIAAVTDRGFRPIAHLEYLSRPIPPNPPPPSEGIEFDPYDDSQRDRLKQLVRLTYEGSLDCPGLGETRDLDDVLAGYHATGRYDPQNWFFVREAGAEADAGVLLLAEHPGSDQAELVYMGLAPAARGRGLGAAIVDAALARSARLGVDHLMVAVDAANHPARDIYRRAGFSAWANRWVYVRQRGESVD